jgi:hypothetical protein
MRLLVSLVCIAGAALLLYYGNNASEAPVSVVKEAFTGTPTDRSVLLLIGGVVLGVIGLASLTASLRPAKA